LQLEPVDLPYYVKYLWDWFCELSDGRTYTGMGQALPISWTEILAWSKLTGSQPTMWEVKALKSIDQMFLIETGKNK